MNGRPLDGLTILVPRPEGQASELSRLLRERGAQPLEVSVTAIRPPLDPRPLATAIDELLAGRYRWVAFTSVNAVEAVRAEQEAGAGRVAGATRKDSPLGRARVAAVGGATAGALRAWGITVDLVPPTSSGRALGAAFPDDGEGARVLLPRSDIADRGLPEVLRARGYEAVEIVAYRTVQATALPDDVRRRIEDGAVDWVACTAPSTVEALARLCGDRLGPPVRLAAIGPTTADSIQRAGLYVAAEAAEQSAAGLAEAIEGVVTSERSAP